MNVGRLVVVTGGTRGIGRAVAEAFAALGDRVVALARTTGREPGDAIEARQCDVSDEAAVTRCFDDLGAVDVLVNNAGVAESAPLDRTTLASWEQHLAVNATGAFLTTRAVLPGMRERGSGSIVTVASTAGRVGSRYTTAYTASKHAAVGLMRATAAELAGSGVTANAVCPTFVDTDMTRESAERIAERTGRTPEQSLGALEAASPLGRLLRPDEVAAAVVWLASPQAASVNGQAIVLDGGGIQA